MIAPTVDGIDLFKIARRSILGRMPIESQPFLDGSTLLVECPDCAAMRSLELRRGVLRFPSHEKRKTHIPNTGQRWVKRETAWKVV